MKTFFLIDPYNSFKLYFLRFFKSWQVHNWIFLFRAVLGLQQIERKIQRFPKYLLLPHACIPSLSTSLSRVVHLIIEPTLIHPNHSRSKVYLKLHFCFVHCLDLDACIMTCIHRQSIIRMLHLQKYSDFHLWELDQALGNKSDKSVEDSYD